MTVTCLDPGHDDLAQYPTQVVFRRGSRHGRRAAHLISPAARTVSKLSCWVPSQNCPTFHTIASVPITVPSLLQASFASLSCRASRPDAAHLAHCVRTATLVAPRTTPPP